MKNNPNPLITRLQSLNLLKGGNALDIGAGGGKDSLFLAEHGYNVTALEKNIELLKKNINESKIVILEDDITRFSLQPQTYDLIIANNVLPFLHKNEVKNTVKKIIDSLKTEGFFCFSLFGQEDEWKNKDNMNFWKYDDALVFLSEFPIEVFFQSTEKGYGSTMKGGIKFWEIHKFIVKKK